MNMMMPKENEGLGSHRDRFELRYGKLSMA